MPQRLHSQAVVLVTGAVGDIQDVRIVREGSRLVYVELAIGRRRVVVVLPRALPHRRADIGNAETGVPLLALDGEVVLEAVGSLQVRVLRRGQSHVARSAGAGGREHAR